MEAGELSTRLKGTPVFPSMVLKRMGGDKKISSAVSVSHVRAPEILLEDVQ